MQRRENQSLVIISVLDPKRYFSESDYFLQVIPDPDLTFKVIPDLIPDRGQSQTLWPSRIECFLTNQLEVFNIIAALFFYQLKVLVYLMTSKSYNFDIN